VIVAFNGYDIALGAHESEAYKKSIENSNAVTYTYDNLDRLTVKQYPDSTAVNYTYDLLGRLTQAADPTGVYSLISQSHCEPSGSLGTGQAVQRLDKSSLRFG
jgi:YD repeat-containing protein